MMLLVHSAPRTLEPYRTEHLGVLCSPRCVYADDIETWPNAADNDAYSKWDAGKYRAMLERLRGRRGLIFVSAPDVVGDAAETLRRFDQWRSELDGFPVAFVGQDGLSEPPWDDFAAFFVGGSTEWKLGTQAARLMREAKSRGKWVHVGRTNSYTRVRYAWGLDCDSIDGTQFSWFRDAKLAPMLRSLRLAEKYRESMRRRRHRRPADGCAR